MNNNINQINISKPPAKQFTLSLLKNPPASNINNINSSNNSNNSNSINNSYSINNSNSSNSSNNSSSQTFIPKPTLPVKPPAKQFNLSLLNRPSSVNNNNNLSQSQSSQSSSPLSSQSSQSSQSKGISITSFFKGISAPNTQESTQSNSFKDNLDFYDQNTLHSESTRKINSSYNSSGSSSNQVDPFETFEDVGNNQYKLVGDYYVKFPFKPYPSQASMMSRIISGLDKKENCLLESPTGTGKTLTLLCSALQWQSQDKIKQIKKCEEKKKLARESKERATKKMRSADGKPLSVKLEDLNDSSSNNDSSNSSTTTTTTTTTTTSPNNIKSEYEDMDFNDEDYYYKGLQTDFKPISSGVNGIKIKPIVNLKRNREDLKSSKNGSNIVSIKNLDDNTEDEEKDQVEKFRPKSSPTIFFCSRTHSQIKQLTDELSKTPYRPNMVVLASRDHYCINSDLKDVPKKKERCKKIIQDPGCRYYSKKDFDLPSISTFKKGGAKEVWDIEDLKKAGKEHRECPFFVSKDMLPHADLVFCPYNYLIDPSIRRTLKEKVKNSIVIFDEAHNIEDALMDASSFEATLEELNEHTFQVLKQVRMNPKLINLLDPAKESAINFIHPIMENLVIWIKKKSDSLKPVDFEKHSNVWKGKEIFAMLEQIGISDSNYFEFASYVKTLGDGGEDSESEKKKSKSSLEKAGSSNKKAEIADPIPLRALAVLESLSKVFDFMFTNKNWIDDYVMVLQKATVFTPSVGKKQQQQQQQQGSKWSYSLGIWALSPRIAFSSLNQTTRSIILTSGTLSPLYSFPKELASPFPVLAEMGNLSDIKQRAWIGTISHGTNNQKLLCTHSNTDSFSFQDSLGETILEHIKVIPSGVLVFFPSYGFLEKILKRWDETTLLDSINNIKPVFYEPKNTKEFNQTLQGYRETVKEDPKKGAILFAVCRGKVSEGIDFSDEYARGVIVVGIPYPNLKDLRVELKKKHNDINHSLNKGISGSDWYNLQAYRALNQALGRCIRNKNDYGSILLIDERFTQERNWSSLSKWTRQCIQNNKYLNNSIKSLKDFFNNINNNHSNLNKFK